MLTKFGKKMRAFTTVEILVAVGLVAILMVVAVPRLLDSRETVSDSAAKRQLNSTMLSAQNWFAERDTYDGLDLTTGTVCAEDVLNCTKLQERLPEVELVGAGTPSSKGTNGRALTVSVSILDQSTVVMAASNGEETCWGIRLSTTGTQYYGKRSGICSANQIDAETEGWQSFEFPILD